MTATNTDFINQILSSTDKLCDKGVERVQGVFNHASSAWPQRWSRPGQV